MLVMNCSECIQNNTILTTKIITFLVQQKDTWKCRHPQANHMQKVLHSVQTLLNISDLLGFGYIQLVTPGESPQIIPRFIFLLHTQNLANYYFFLIRI